jgi:leucine dehydrogenase
MEQKFDFMIKEINAKNHPSYAGHEKVFYFEDKPTKLKGFIAWHNTKLGPATGGTRLFNYSSKKEALKDVLRLSEAMTYKCAVSGLPFGGGKNVIIASKNLKNDKFLSAYAKIIDSFKGRCTTGTDVGISDEDAIYMSKITPYILRGNKGNTTTSEMASYGIYVGIKKSLKLLIPNKSNKDLHITIKGIGKIGFNLAKLLIKDGFKVTVADIDKEKIIAIKKLFPSIKVSDFKNIHKIKSDIYSPCAMGGEFSLKTIKELNCHIIAGGSNNQLQKESLSKELYNRGIWYIPDFLINSGGLIQIVDELDKSGYNKKRVNSRVKKIGEIISQIIKKSQISKKDTLTVTKDIINSKIYVK